MITSHTYEDLYQGYVEFYRDTGKKKLLVYLGLVKLLKENGYFDAAYIFQSHCRLFVTGIQSCQYRDHERIGFEIIEKENRCDITVNKYIDKTILNVYSTSIPLDDLRLFQYEFLLFLSHYIKQPKEYRQINMSEYLHRDFPIKLDGEEL
jgi:hypothetical protein